jgi:hypothetical protein
MMQSPGPARPAADGTLVEPADVDEMVGMFQSLLPGVDAGQARRRLAEHGWDLQAAIKGAAREDAALAPFDGAPLWSDAAPQLVFAKKPIATTRAARPRGRSLHAQLARAAKGGAPVARMRHAARRQCFACFLHAFHHFLYFYLWFTLFCFHRRFTVLEPV